MKEDKNLRRLRDTGRLTSKGSSPAWGIRREFKEFGLILSSVRIVSGLSQQEFSKLIGVSRPTLSYYENGIFQPTTDHAKKIAETILTLLISKNEAIGMLEGNKEEK